LSLLAVKFTLHVEPNKSEQSVKNQTLKIAEQHMQLSTVQPPQASSQPLALQEHSSQMLRQQQQSHPDKPLEQQRNVQGDQQQQQQRGFFQNLRE
jgi:hypothetical protein